MALVDAEGRLFGRWNFIDAVVALLLLGLIPIGYAAYALFRTPPPVITSLEPGEVVEGPGQRITIRGEHLRPYLRVSFNTLQGASFLFEDSTKAVVDLHPMPPGIYDVILYDFRQERHRLPGALTVKARIDVPAPQEAIITGRFINLPKESVQLIQKGMTVPFAGEVLEVAPPRPSLAKIFFAGAAVDMPAPQHLEVPAMLKVPCQLKVTQGLPECGGPDFSFRPRYILTNPGSGNPLSFQVDQLRGVGPVETLNVRVRVTGVPEAVALLRAGDTDLELASNPFSLGARIASVEGGAGSRLATLTVRAQRSPDGWWNGAVMLRVSGQLFFATDRYAISATVLSIDDNGR